MSYFYPSFVPPASVNNVHAFLRAGIIVLKRILNSLENLLRVDLSPDTLRIVRIDFSAYGIDKCICQAPIFAKQMALFFLKQHLKDSKFS